MTDCPDLHLNASSPSLSGCPTFFDGLVCWPTTTPGQNARVPCTSVEAFRQLTISYLPDAPVAGYAYRECMEDDMIWAEKANYSECLAAISRYEEPVSPAENKRILACISFYLSITSLTFLLLSLLIFCFKTLQCDRVRVHRNFMISLVMLYLVTILYYQPYIYSTQQVIWYKTQPWMCRMMLSCLMFGYLSPVFWMFIEGLYLHSRLATNIFDSTAPFKIYYTIGWVLPVVITVIWVVGMVFSCEEECWEDQSNHNISYMIILPMMFALAVNLLFLINIVRIIVTKLRNQPQLTTQQLQFRKAVRATLILFPLLGLTNLLFFINPRSLQRREHELTYMYVNSVLKSSQGILLSLLYCFFNSEVQEAIRRFFRKLKIRLAMHDSFTRGNSTRSPHSTIFLDIPRQDTLLGARKGVTQTQLGGGRKGVTESQLVGGRNGGGRVTSVLQRPATHIRLTCTGSTDRQQSCISPRVEIKPDENLAETLEINM